jgi:hypothetical protein
MFELGNNHIYAIKCSCSGKVLKQLIPLIFVDLDLLLR